MKVAINQKINKLSEDQLQAVLDILEKAELGNEEPSSHIELTFNEAAAQYGGLLKRLAE